MRESFRLHSTYDTETTNIDDDRGHRAFACLYIFDDVHAIDLREYEPGHAGEKIHLLRSVDDSLSYIDQVIADGLAGGYVPVIAAYNLMFDLQTLMGALDARWQLVPLAQSSTHVYVLDVFEGDAHVLRFWDTFFLEMGGLAAMGATCGVAKASGDWDYSLVRTPATPLTDEEIGYASRDVQVIPAYLRYLLEANAFLAPEDLGGRVITKTGIVRAMARDEIGNLTYVNRHGKRVKLAHAYRLICAQEAAPSYGRYAIRRASFYGGWTFTAARFASVVVRNVASLDVTSMHHTFIDGRFVPVRFREKPADTLDAWARQICATSIDSMLARYAKPFLFAFHALFRFRGLRLRAESPFERWGIALIPQSKFSRAPVEDRVIQSDSSSESEVACKARGWVNRARGATFAFGKLYTADVCEIYISELELATISLVYEWDEMEAVGGEGTIEFARPADYVVLQSHVLFSCKQAMKGVLRDYVESVPLPCDDASVPEHVRAMLADGSAPRDFLESYYNSTVKGMFNGIYGTQAMDEMRPDFRVSGGDVQVAHETVATPENFAERAPKTPKVHYQYGIRIVGGSRLHLAIAMMLLDRELGSRVDVLGGDTDSLKVRCDEDVTDAELSSALAPLADASARAIERVSERVRRAFPDLVSDLAGVGAFEVEQCGGESTRWREHMEAWNKARLSLSQEGNPHVTCAGLSRPRGTYTIEDAIADMMEARPFAQVAPDVLGYDVTVGNEICHALQRTHPSASDRIDEDVTDHLGSVAHVSAPEAVALYASDRVLGDMSKQANHQSVAYIRRKYGREVDIAERRLELIDGKPFMERTGADELL